MPLLSPSLSFKIYLNQKKPCAVRTHWESYSYRQQGYNAHRIQVPVYSQSHHVLRQRRLFYTRVGLHRMLFASAEFSSTIIITSILSKSFYSQREIGLLLRKPRRNARPSCLASFRPSPSRSRRTTARRVTCSHLQPLAPS